MAAILTTLLQLLGIIVLAIACLTGLFAVVLLIVSMVKKLREERKK